MVEDASIQMWECGELGYKLHSTQIQMYEDFKNCNSSLFIMYAQRRIGKTWYLLVLALMEAIKTSGTKIDFIIPWTRQFTNSIVPTLRKILKDSPLKVSIKDCEKQLLLPNNSYIQFIGSDSIRGVNLHDSSLVILDEFLVFENKEYIKQQLRCQYLLGDDKSKIVISSSRYTTEQFNIPVMYEYNINPFLSEEEQKNIDELTKISCL